MTTTLRKQLLLHLHHLVDAQVPGRVNQPLHLVKLGPNDVENNLDIRSRKLSSPNSPWTSSNSPSTPMKRHQLQRMLTSSLLHRSPIGTTCQWQLRTRLSLLLLHLLLLPETLLPDLEF